MLVNKLCPKFKQLFNFYLLLFILVPINRQAGISENVYITVQNDTYGNEQRGE